MHENKNDIGSTLVCQDFTGPMKADNTHLSLPSWQLTKVLEAIRGKPFDVYLHVISFHKERLYQKMLLLNTNVLNMLNYIMFPAIESEVSLSKYIGVALK